MSWLLTFTQKVSLTKKKMGSRVCAHKLINPNESEVHLKNGTYIPPPRKHTNDEREDVDAAVCSVSSLVALPAGGVVGAGGEGPRLGEGDFRNTEGVRFNGVVVMLPGVGTAASVNLKTSLRDRLHLGGSYVEGS
jgi:hypothetical protein